MLESLAKRFRISQSWLIAACAIALATVVFGAYIAFRPDPCHQENRGPFDGEVLYSCLVKTVAQTHLSLADAKARSAWLDQWEDKYEDKNLLETESGTLQAITEMLLSVHGRFDYVFAPEQAAQNAIIESGQLAGIGISVGLSGSTEQKQQSTELDLPEHMTPQLRAVIKSKFTMQSEDTTLDTAHMLTVMANPEEGTPAFNAGIRAGDILIAVNGQDLNGQKLSWAMGKLRGPAGTAVELTIMRSGTRKNVHVVRSMISLKAVSQKEIGDIGYLKIDHFESMQVVQDVHNSIESLCRSNGSSSRCRLNALIVDLRDNPGGLMDGVLGISELFIDDGNLTTIMQRSGDGFSRVDVGLMAGSIVMREGNSISVRQRDFAVGLPLDTPIVVLVNENSASGAEMLAAILKQQRHALIVGTQTRGKGVGQCTMPLPFGYVANIICLEYLAGGQAVDWSGVIPDVSKSQGNTQRNDDQLSEAITRAGELIAKTKQESDGVERSIAQRKKEYEIEVERTLSRFLR